MPGQQHRPETAQGSQSPARSPNAGTGTSTATSTSPGPSSSGANPSNLSDTAGNATTTHAAPGVGDAFNAPDTTAWGTSTEVSMNVRILHGRENPLRAGCPLETALYTVVNTDPVSSTDPNVHSITTKTGDGVDPGENEAVLDTSSLYIGGAPDQSDVHQVGFADCYFMASLVNVVNQDPSHVTSMVSGNHTAATVNLFRYDGTQWQPWSYSTDATLAYSVDSAGDRQGLIGASFRVSELPSISDWWVEDRGGELVICRKEQYQAALWAPVLEKAYAAYIEANGQYGGFSSGNTGAGYEAINGGVAQFSYLVMYGNAANVGEADTNYTPGADLVATNLPAIRNLLQVSGQGMGANQQFMMTAMISPDDSVTRLGQIVTYILGRPDSQRYSTLRVHLTKLQTEVNDWTNADATSKSAKRDKVIQRATNLATPGNWPLLHSATAPKEYRDLNELCNVVMHLGSDSSSGQRSIYAWHSYSVQGATFKDAQNADLAVTLSNLTTTSAQIDPTRSQVRLRNPHGTNVPNPDAATDPPDQNDGVFTLSLDQYFRMFATQQFGTVNT